MIDIAMRYFLGPGPSMAPKKKQEVKPKENKYENPLKDADIDTSLDEDDDFAEDKKTKNKNKKKDDKEKEDEKEKEKEKKDKKKKKKKNKDEADDEEEEEKEVLTIIYDKKSFGKYYETLKKEIMGNFTNFDIVDQEYPLPANKKFFSKITFFTQMGVSLLIFSGQKLKDKLTIIPSAVFDGIEKNKWFVMIGNFLLHQWLNKNLSTTGAFEIYYKDRIIFSKLATNKLPKEADIHKEIKRINKRIKGKNKKKKYEEDDDDDEDL
jgi:selT/selW/selH-like putative selenoprotein